MGLLDMLMPGNPFSGWLDQNRGKVTGAFSGLAGAGNDPRAALQGWVGGLQHGVSVDQENAIIRQKQAEDAMKIATEQEEQSKRIAWLQQNAPQIAPLYEMGFMAPEDVSKSLKGDASSGPYNGTGMDAQNWNILLTGDPASPEYAAAWSQINQPKITYTQGPDGLVPVIQNPNIPPSIRPPTGIAAQTGGGAPPAVPGSGPTAGPAIPGTAPKPTEAQTKAQLLSTVMAPDVQALLGDGTPANPGTFDALANGWDQARAATGDIGRALGQGPSSDYQRAIPAIKSIIASYLYVTSGATANPGEVETQTNNLLPRFGEDPKAVAEKKARLQTMYQAVLAAAGPAQQPGLVQTPYTSGGDLKTKYGLE